MLKQPKKRPRKSKTQESINLSKIKHAITRFISRTEKIVQKVDPEARIVMAPKKRGIGRPRKHPIVAPSPNDKNMIDTPQFKQGDSSFEDTDDEAYLRTHDVKEHTESLLRFRPELRKIKASGRSTKNVHHEKKTEENFQANLAMLQLFLPETTIEEYRIENINLIPLPQMDPLENGIININLD